MKPANQSSLWNHKTTSLAVDGNIEWAFWPWLGADDEFSLTEESANQWWRMDMEKVYVIDAINIYNRESYGE